ncbi:hypothetical protein V9T40_001010 [Parthenolecanium corni]|uniref:General transcription factor 3C polypeptide 5 n=1 Tax=Parthenolecanium corni TaxID=536013 RepID=A0AAN9TRH2_9HEMI
MEPNAESALKTLVCVEFPGKVVNADRAIQCLGGLNKIAKAWNDQSKLECRFRPDNIFCKPTCADRIKSTSFVLKVTTKKKKSTSGENERVVVGASIYGKVEYVFKFCNLNDFQYLPMETNADGECKSIHNDLVPKPQLPLTWESDTVPFCFPPITFSRTDSVQPYLSTKVTEEKPGLIGRTRDRRSNYVKFVTHDAKEIPTTPHEHTIRYIQLKFVTEEQIRHMKQLFSDRPVWTKSALECVTRYPGMQLKYLLALNAYHFTSGPFRIAWVRFGYDPRKEPSARKYQILDYRLRNYVFNIMKERLPQKFIRGGRMRNVKNENMEKIFDPFDESLYKFKPGFIPPQKQVFYQVCDIEIPEVQDKLKSFTESKNYDSKNGWLTESFLDKIREAIDKQVLAYVNNTEEGSDPTSGSYIPMENVEINHDDSADEMAEMNHDDSADERDFDVSDQDDFMDAEDL